MRIFMKEVEKAMTDFRKIAFVNLSELYLTREQHEKALRQMNRRLRNCRGFVFLLFCCVGLLAGVATEQKLRLENIEWQIREKDEMAG